MKRTSLYVALIAAAVTVGSIYNVGTTPAGAAPAAQPENTTPQTLPFTQDWSNAALITANDDWSLVLGIEGYLGQDISTTIGVDPRTLLTSSASATDIDVIANQTNPDTLTAGGIAEFDTIANPVVAMQGSGTADVPYLLLYLNTTGQNNIRVAFDARDIDNSADNSVQQLNVQYRVGSTGNFSNVPGGYFADVSAGPSLTQSTPVAVTLPALANNQALVQVRIMSVNAPGSDEWIGIDNISVTPNGPVQTRRAHADFNGDGRTDFAVTRNEGGLKVWYGQYAGSSTTFARQWGLDGDTPALADYDGDGKTDIAVWRRGGGADPRSYFYILNSSNSTFRADQFGSEADDPDIVGDYDGDGKADLAVFRGNGTPLPCGAGKASFYYRPSGTPGTDFVPVCWGQNGDRAAPGDYDGDGKFDFLIGRIQSGQIVFYLRNSSNGSLTVTFWGKDTDAFVPGDYDGDGRWDYAVARPVAPNSGEFYILEADGGGTGAQPIVFGNVDVQNDSLAPGDYDGDGRTDVALWKPGSPGMFIIRKATGQFEFFPFGQTGDRPVAEELVVDGP